MATARRLPSGSWRVQVYAGRDAAGKRIYQSFTAPTKKEAEYVAAEYIFKAKTKSHIRPNFTVGEAFDDYIASRKNILSPATIQGYNKIRNNNLQYLMNIKINKITQQDIQMAVNKDADRLSAKTISNAHGLLASVIRVYRPDLILQTSLPQQKRILKELIDPADIMRIIKGTEIELPVLLAMWLSFSMSEIRGIKKDDIKNGIVTLNRSVVDIDGKPVIKEDMKEEARTRKHRLPEYIMQLIGAVDGDYIVPLSGQAIYKRWSRLLEKHELPHITFHDLRHVNASVMLLLNIPDKYAMERGGWKTDKTMKKVYQNTFSAERIAVDSKVNNYFESIIQHEMQHEK